MRSSFRLLWSVRSPVLSVSSESDSILAADITRYVSSVYLVMKLPGVTGWRSDNAQLRHWPYSWSLDNARWDLPALWYLTAKHGSVWVVTKKALSSCRHDLTRWVGSIYQWLYCDAEIYSTHNAVASTLCLLYRTLPVDHHRRRLHLLD